MPRSRTHRARQIVAALTLSIGVTFFGVAAPSVGSGQPTPSRTEA
jgi:hypothetical protein